MSYEIMVIFSTSDDDEHAYDFILRDFILEDDWTCSNYWDYIGTFVSHLISEGENHLHSMYPNGHDFSLAAVHVFPFNCDSEDVG